MVKTGMKPRLFEDRYWEKVNETPGLGPNGDCWEWKASKRGYKGYGNIRYGGRKGCTVLAHRAAWFIEYGEWPEHDVLHRCDNPACVNPNHLFAGNNDDNVDDMHDKGRDVPPPLKIGTDHGMAKLNDDQVRAIRNSRETATALGRKFGITRQTITNIRLRKTWKHLS